MATTSVPHWWKYVFPLTNSITDFQEDLKRPEVDNWKEALSMAATKSGWISSKMTNGEFLVFVYEYKFIDCISKDILKKLSDGPLHVGENLVGVDSHIDKLNLSRFVGRSEDIICSEGPTVHKAKNALSRYFCFGYVDHRASVRHYGFNHPSWFCPGSFIIFTCKDKQLLKSHRVDEIHDMNFLDEDQSLQLFCFYAFEEKHPSTDFQGLAYAAVKYVQGHPLALTILGCFLYGKNVAQWVSELDRLKLHPNEEIQQATQAVEILDIQQKRSGQKFDIDVTAFAQMKNLRILKLPKDDA
ncbi:NB-ARC domains-containing protein [Tanacetum coccineum]